MTATEPAARTMGAQILMLLTGGEMDTAALADATGIAPNKIGTVLNYLKSQGKVVKTRDHKTGTAGHPATWALAAPARP